MESLGKFRKIVLNETALDIFDENETVLTRNSEKHYFLAISDKNKFL
jgi:hypothetical protein